ncbi:hypothetical protein PV350_01935 [Streptomyces sp. PA03-6a]|nr:hypothetical protein [Streptomyces sp. PA03-6a]MDX2812910.1 hypothetical protein [Streptomyces sp. PA03-5A]
MDFQSDGQFMPPADVTTVFVQAWGAGGGGEGGDFARTGAGAGAGGFAWCVLPVQSGTPVVVDVGTGGAGGPASGFPGTPSTVDNGLGDIVTAEGGARGLIPGGAGGTASCPGQGTVRQGNNGANGTLTGPIGEPGGQGGRPAVDGIIQPAPQGAGIGGSGGARTIGLPALGENGGPGYVVIWW